MVGQRCHCGFYAKKRGQSERQDEGTLLGGHGGRAGAVEVDVLPLAVAAVPDAGLLRLHGARHAAAVDVLGEADVGDAGGLVPDQVDVGIEEDGVDWLLPLGQSCRGRQT